MNDDTLQIAIADDVGWAELVAPLWRQALDRCGVNHKTVDLLTDSGWEDIRDCDGFMWRLGNKPPDRLHGETILRIVDRVLGIPTYPSLQSYWHYDDKIRQAYLFKLLDIPSPRTWVFWRYEDAMNWVEQCTLPVVGKLSMGAGSQNVQLLRERRQCRRIIEAAFRDGIWPRDDYGHIVNGNRMALFYLQTRRYLRGLRNLFGLKNLPPEKVRQFADRAPENRYVYFQEFMPGNEHDTRVLIMGDKAFAFQRLNRADDFRASGSGMIQYDPERIDKAFVTLAFNACDKLDAEVMAFDGIYNPQRQPVFAEMSYTFLYDAVSRCPGYWTRDGDYVEEAVKAEDLHMNVFLKRVRAHKQHAAPCGPRRWSEPSAIAYHRDILSE